MTHGGRTTLAELCDLKRAGRRFSVLTCYDAALAALMQAAGIEVLLVGDTAAEVVLGLESTRQINPTFLIHLTAAVRRGAPDVFLMSDLPHGCRQGEESATIDWLKRFHLEPGSDAVKVEVSGDDVGLVEVAVSQGVPIVAHLGLLPQRIDSHDGYRAQARDAETAERLIGDARRFVEAGACMLLLEAVASEVAGEIARRSEVPVIGCVAGPHCDGTVVVLHDMIGLGGGHPPRGVRTYANLSETLSSAFKAYADDIHTGRFPTEQDAPHMRPGEYEKLSSNIGEP